MKNLTISLDEELARWVRVKAAEQDKSQSRFISDVIRQLREQNPTTEEARRAYEAAYKRFLSVKPVRLRDPGEKLPTRDEIYDRKVFRR